MEGLLSTFPVVSQVQKRKLNNSLEWGSSVWDIDNVDSLAFVELCGLWHISILHKKSKFPSLFTEMKCIQGLVCSAPLERLLL